MSCGLESANADLIVEKSNVGMLPSLTCSTLSAVNERRAGMAKLQRAAPAAMLSPALPGEISREPSGDYYPAPWAAPLPPGQLT